MRRKIARLFYVAATVAGIAFVATCIYGISKYPAAPIRPRDGAFTDKLGKVYTEQEYQAFESWKQAMMLSGAACFALAFAGQIVDKKPKRGTEAGARLGKGA